MPLQTGNLAAGQHDREPKSEKAAMLSRQCHAPGLDDQFAHTAAVCERFKQMHQGKGRLLVIRSAAIIHGALRRRQVDADSNTNV